MKAIIMAGGEGSRLRPLTCDIPKPMARLLGRPILEYILDLLESHGFTQAAVTVRYLPGVISEHFGEGSYGKVSLDFVEEDQPLGTAGSVKNACGEKDRDILVISGDAMCDFDLSRAMAFHREKGADVTILAKRVEDPREYGLIDVDSEGGIAAFIEKPAFSQAISDLANTGIYILSKSALDLIPNDTFFDFAKDLFPKMLEKKMKLMCLEDDGYWCDIGDLESYIRCQHDMLSGKVSCRIQGKRDEAGNVFAGNPPPRDCVVDAPSYIGRDVQMEPGAHIAASVVDNGCHIGRNARVTGSVLLQNCYIGGRARLTGALACASATIKAGAMLFESATVGGGAVVGQNATINPGVKVWNGKRVPASAIVAEHVKVSAAPKGFFGDDGITGQIGVELTPEFMARVGAAIGSLNPSARVAVGSSTESGAKVLKDALSAGIQSTGAGVMDFGENFRSHFEFCMNFCSTGLGVYIRGDNRAGLRVMNAGGLPANRETERSIEGILSRGEFVRCPHDAMGDKVEMSGMGMLYKSQLIRLAAKGLTGCSAQVRSRNLEVQNVLRDTLYQLGCDVSGGITLEVSSQGDKVRVYDAGLGYISSRKVFTWCAIGELQKGFDVAVPFDAPHILEEAAGRYGRRVLRYYDCPADDSDKDARSAAQAQMWSRDGLMQAVMLMNMVKRMGGMASLMRNLPDFGLATRTLDTPGNPARLIRHINTQKAGEITEGVVVKHDRGLVLVKPLKQGAGLKIMAEAVNAEIAAELCADMEKILQKNMEDTGSGDRS